MLTGRSLVAALTAVLVFSTVLYGAYRVWDQPIPLGHDVVAREVCAMLDSTLSMDPKARSDAAAVNFARAKAIVSERVLSALGPGDRFCAYRVGTSFAESTHRIVNSDLGPVPERLLEGDAAPRVSKEMLLTRWKTVTARVGDWRAAIDAVRLEAPDRSSYLDAFAYLASRADASRRAGIPFELVVVGDAKESPAPVPFVPPPPLDDEHEAFAGVTVRFVSPYRADARPGERSAVEWKTFWSQYFRDRGAPEVVFAPFDGRDPVVSASQVRRAPVDEEALR